MNIGILIGTVRNNRESIKVARALEKELSKNTVHTVDFIDLMDFKLPPLEAKFKPDLPDKDTTDKTARALYKRIMKIDALIIVTPEYNGGIPGTLKNTIDYFEHIWGKKPIGISTVSDGRFGGIQTSFALQLMILHLKSYPMPYKLVVSKVLEVFDTDGNIIREDFKTDLERFLREYIPFAEAIVGIKI